MPEKAQELGPVATKVLYEDDDIRIWDQRLEPGQLLPAHKHECDYLLCDVSGDLIEAESLPGINAVTAKKAASTVAISGLGILKSSVSSLKTSIDALKNED